MALKSGGFAAVAFPDIRYGFRRKSSFPKAEVARAFQTSSLNCVAMAPEGDMRPRGDAKL
jgi:hypothetical protein